MKKIIKHLLIILLLTININVFASTNTYERKEENNYGVNKKWDITNKENVIINLPYVDSNEKIYDFADILTDEEEKILYEKINIFIQTYKTDLVLLTSDFTYTNDYENEDYAVNFYDFNDFGLDFDNYSGILFFRNNNEQDKYYDIYTFGNAQLYFSDDRYNELLDDIYYDISNQNYLFGYNKLIDYLSNYYKNGIEDELKNYYIDEYGYLKEYYSIPVVSIIMISIGTTSTVIIILVKKNKMIKKERSANEYLKKDSVIYKNKQDKFLRKHVTHYVMSSSSSSGSSGGYSGGGHSSGGGRHG